MKNFFTSDWHLGEDRIGVGGKPNLFYRPFPSVVDQDYHIYCEFLKSEFKDGDTLWHLGDVVYDLSSKLSLIVLNSLRKVYPNSKFKLIVGNYDDGKLDKLVEIFDAMESEATIKIGGREFYLNHYPAKCVDKEFAITGHIHGLWKVQKNMINVGVDAWHFKPVSEEEILFCREACEKHYDKNVFPY